MNIYNAGDIPADIQIIFKDKPSGTFSVSLYSSKDTQNALKTINFKEISFFEGDTGLILDSKIKMVKGIENNEKLTLSGHQYNKYKTSGDFFKIPTTDDDEEYFIIKSGVNFEVKYKHHYI
jgi:O-phosphoseryl-tRNA(Cys) synthetase